MQHITHLQVRQPNLDRSRPGRRCRTGEVFADMRFYYHIPVEKHGKHSIAVLTTVLKAK